MFEIISTYVAAALTLCIFSFLYRDNPFYRFAEYLLVGVSMGYSIPLSYYKLLIPYLYQPIFLEHKYWYILPALIGTGYLFRFSRKYSWLSRYPMVFGLAMTGLGVPLGMHASVLVQMRSAMRPIEGFTADGLNTFLIFIGTVSVLTYFFFSKPHKGLYGKFSRMGIWYMMIGFGASFGYTVMARMSLLIGRIQFLINDVLHLID